METAADIDGMCKTEASTGRTGRLSPLEWSIVALAERDTLSTLEQPGRIASALGSLFGQRPANRLADPRLEALRRFAVFAWRWGSKVPRDEITAFINAGFTPPQYEVVRHSILAARRQSFEA